MTSRLPFEEIEHTADFALRVRGRTLDELFVNAARGMAALARVEAKTGRAVQRELTLEAPDAENLLVDWLNELLFLMEHEELVFVEYDLQVTPNRLQATIKGGALADPAIVIKAATYHNLQIVQHGNEFEVTIVFDV